MALIICLDLKIKYQRKMVPAGNKETGPLVKKAKSIEEEANI